MTRQRLRGALLAAAAFTLPIAGISTLSAPPAYAIPVFDSANYAQNILQAARALEQINNQITQLQNEAQMLINQARNLASLPYSGLAELQASVQRTQQLLIEAQRIAHDVADIERAFTERYGEAAAVGDHDAMVQGARERWADTVASFEDALRVQAGVVGNIESARAEMQTLVAQSQGATGALQAAQAGNQLLALQSTQMADLTAAIAAQNRAQALEVARRASAEAQAQENLSRFLDYGAGYEPTTVRMFQD